MLTLMRLARAAAGIVAMNLILATPGWCEVTDTMRFMREEEKLARDVYATLYAAWGSQVFDHIAYSEQRHMNAMGRLLATYAIPDPVEETGVDPGVYPDSCTADECVFLDEKLAGLYVMLMADGAQSQFAGLLVGGLIEEKDMIDIQAAIEETDDEHIRSVYGRLLCGSTNHLRAFARNIEQVSGTAYLDASKDYIRAAEEALQVELRTDASEDAITEILASPMRKCGMGNL